MLSLKRCRRTVLAVGLALGSAASVQAAPPGNGANNLPSPNATIRNQPTAKKSESWFPWSSTGGTKKTAAAPAKPTKTDPLSVESEIEAEINRGMSFEKVGDLDRARKIYTELRIKHPNRPEPAHRLGVVADQQRKHGEAEKLFVIALDLNPRNPQYMNDLGYCYYLQGRFKEAEAMLTRAVQMQPKSVRYHNNLGLVLGQQGRYGEALQHMAVSGSEADAYFNLAFVYASQEKASEAKECFRKTLQLNPTHQRAREALSSFTKYETLPPHLREAEEYTDERGTKWVPYNENAPNQIGDSSADGQVRQASAETPVTTKTDTAKLNRDLQQRMRNASTRGGRESR